MQVSKETGEDRMGEFWVDHCVARVRLAWRRLGSTVTTGCLPIIVTQAPSLVSLRQKSS